MFILCNSWVFISNKCLFLHLPAHLFMLEWSPGLSNLPAVTVLQQRLSCLLPSLSTCDVWAHVAPAARWLRGLECRWRWLRLRHRGVRRGRGTSCLIARLTFVGISVRTCPHFFLDENDSRQKAFIKKILTEATLPALVTHPKGDSGFQGRGWTLRSVILRLL